MSDIPVRPIEEKDQPSLREIWTRSFGEDIQYPFAFFRAYPEPEGLASDVDGRPACSMYMLDDFMFISGSETFPCPYLYALAALPEHQRKGLGGAVLSSLTELAIERHGSAFTKPASESLYDWYARFGYAPVTYMEVLYHTADMLPEPRLYTQILKTDGASYGRLREILMANVPHICFGANALEYLDDCCRLGNGYPVFIQYGDDVGCAAAEVYDGILYLKELLCPAENTPFVLSALCTHFRVDAVQAHVPVNSGSRRVVPCVCAKQSPGTNAVPQNTWWGPVFD